MENSKNLKFWKLEKSYVATRVQVELHAPLDANAWRHNTQDVPSNQKTSR